MKKKIISSILAVAMMASIAIPSVFAASSDVAGDAKKITKITMKEDKQDYNIEVGKSINFKDEIIVYENETKLVLDHNQIRYMLNGSTGSGNTGHFSIADGEVTATKAGADATLTIFDNYNASSNARVTINLHAVPTASATGYAESFTFKSPNYVVPFTSPTGNAETLEIVAKAHPDGTVFNKNDGKLDVAIADVKAKMAAALGFGTASTTITGTKTAGSDITKQVATVIASGTADVTDADDIVFANVATANVTYTVAASGNVVLADIANALNNAAGALYDTVIKDGTLVMTAKTAGVATAPTATVNKGTTATGSTTAALAVTVTGAAAVDTKITFDFTGITPTVGDVWTIAGKTVTVGSGMTLANVLTAFATANPAIDTVWDVTSTATAITLTATGEGNIAVPTALTVSSVATSANTPDVVKHVFQEDDKEIKFTIDASLLTAAQKLLALNNSTVNIYNNYKVLKTSDLQKLDRQVGVFNATANLEIVDAIKAVSFSIPSVIDTTVGKVTKVPVTYYPPQANVGKKALFSIAPTLNNGKAYQYAVVNSDTNPTQVNDEVEILGVNSAGTAILTGKVINGTLSAYSTINVKATNFNTDKPFTSKISTTALEVEAGKIAPVTISNLPNGVTVKWTHKDDGTMGLNKNDGPAVVVTGKKVGTNVLTASLSNGEKFDVAVTVKAATAVAPTPGTGAGNGGATNVPQTGDSLFANLF